MPDRFHNCEYIAARNKLIPQAVKIANEQVSIISADQDDGASLGNWTRAFASAMDDLSKPLLNGKDATRSR
ncbi:MAG: hypothetical protein QOH39_2767 [Verrucomicrobiota bacterium]